MEIQAGVGVIAAPVPGLVGGADIAHVIEEIAGAVLRARHAHVQAHAPVGQARVVLGPAVHRKAFEQAHAPAALRGLDCPLERAACGCVQREVRLRHVEKRLAASLGVGQGGIDARHLLRAQVLDP